METARYTTVALALGLALTGCESGSGGGGPGGGISFRVAWETRNLLASGSATGSRSFATTIPKAVNAVRITVDSAENPGDACCISILRGTPTFTNRVIVLDAITPGDYEVSIAGFPTDFAPADAVSRRCPTNPSGLGEACETIRIAAPSFGSDPAPVTVAADEVADAGDIQIFSLPFPASLVPDVDGAASSDGIDFRAAVADAVNGVVASSIVATVASDDGSVDETLATGTPVACDDLAGGGVPTCSEGGALEVAGFLIAATSGALPLGDAFVTVAAANDASVPRELDFTYPVRVVEGEPTTTTSSTTTTLDTVTTTTAPGSSTSTLPSSTTTTTTTTTTATSTSTTTTLPLQTCVVSFGLEDAVDLSGVSFTVAYGNAQGDFPGADDSVSCRVAPGLPATAAFNDGDAARSLRAALVTATVITGPTGLAECDFVSDAVPSAADFAVTVDEAFDPDFVAVSVTVAVTDITCVL